MDDKTKTPASSPNPVDGFSIPVTVTKQPAVESGSKGPTPLETIEPPTADVPPPAQPDTPGDADIPAAPLQTQPTTPATGAASGKTLAQLMAEEEAKNPVIDPSSMNSHKKSGKAAKLIIVLLILAALVGGAGYAYIKTKDKVKPATNTTTTQQPAATDSKVSGTDIDKSSADLDESLKKVDDTKDYAETDLADSALGL